MLIMALAMVLILSSCRTRISNNTEVASTITDEDGWLTEMYQERRDELGMPVAKKPFFTGRSDDESYEDYDGYDSDMEYLDEYEEDTLEDDLEEEDDDDDSSISDASTSSSTSSTTQRRTSPKTVKRRTTTTTSQKKTSSTSTNKKTETTPATPSEPAETTKKQYTISFDGNGVDMGGASITVEEDGTYTGLPTPPAQEEYVFDGWYTEKEGGTKVGEGEKFNGTDNQTLYAHWTKKDAREIWGNRFDIAANEQTDKLDCWVPGSDSTALKKMGEVVDACKGHQVAQNEGPKCIISFVPNYSVTNEYAETLYNENKTGADENPTALEKVILISDDAIYGSDNQKLFYKLVLLDAMHGKLGQEKIDAAASDLGITEYWMVIWPSDAPAP